MLILFTVVVFLASCGCAFTQTGLSAADQRELLNAHNNLRAGVSPIATNMKKMVNWIRIHSYLVSLIEQDSRPKLEQMQFSFFFSAYTAMELRKLKLKFRGYQVSLSGCHGRVLPHV